MGRDERSSRPRRLVVVNSAGRLRCHGRQRLARLSHYLAAACLAMPVLDSTMHAQLGRGRFGLCPSPCVIPAYHQPGAPASLSLLHVSYQRATGLGSPPMAPSAYVPGFGLVVGVDTEAMHCCARVCVGQPHRIALVPACAPLHQTRRVGREATV